MNDYIKKQKELQMQKTLQKRQEEVKTDVPQMEMKHQEEQRVAGVPREDDLYIERKIGKNGVMEEKIAVLNQKMQHDYFSEENKRAFQDILRGSCEMDKTEGTVTASDEFAEALVAVRSYAYQNLNDLDGAQQQESYRQAKKALMKGLTTLKYRIRIEKLSQEEQKNMQKQIDMLTEIRMDFETAEEKYEEDAAGLYKSRSLQNSLNININKNIKSAFSKDYENALQKVKAYAELDLDQTTEKEQAKKIEEAVREIQNDLLHLENLYQAETNAAKKQILQEQIQTLNRYKLYFDVNMKGQLDTENIPEGSRQEFVEDEKIKKDGILPLSWKDVKEMPLFSHEPTIDDIQQGCLGDCYMEAALADLVVNHPEEIKQCMKDNGDGTVTVRFFEKVFDDQRVFTEGYNPVYIKVKKTIPSFLGREFYSHGAMWAQMIQKAFAASRLGQGDDVDFREYVKNKVWEGHEQEYEDLKKTDKVKAEEMKVKLAAREEKMYKENRISYTRISGGFGNKFLETLQGKPVDVFHARNITGVRIQWMTDVVKKKWFYHKPEDKPFTGEEKSNVDFLMRSVNDIIGKSIKYKNGKAYGPPLNIEDIYEACCSVHLRVNNTPEYSLFLQRNRLDEKSPRLAEDVKKVVDGLWPYMEKALENFAQTYSYTDGSSGCYRIEHRMFSSVKDEKGKVTGKYTPYARGVYQQLEEALKEGKPVGAGTCHYMPEGVTATGLNGESMSGGIVEGHDYSILGVKELNGYKYVLMRNPWKSTGVGYTKITIPGNPPIVKYKEEKVGKEQNGQFLLELNEFMTRVDFFYGIIL